MTKKANVNISVERKIGSLLSKAEKLRSQRAKVAQRLADIDAQMADLELTWNDLRKEISVSVFGDAAPSGEVTMTSTEGAPLKSPQQLWLENQKKKKRKKRKKKRKPVVLRKTKNLGSRDEIRKHAKMRDVKVKRAISKKPGINLDQIVKTVNFGSKQQIQTSLKRLRKQKMIECQSSGRHSTWFSIKKARKKRDK